MPRFSANLSMLFKEVGFLDRFDRAASAGFKGVEFLFPYEWDKDELLERLHRNNLEVVLHNLPAGDWNAGERGLATLADRVDEFHEAVALAVDYASALGCPCLNCLAGIPPVTQDPLKTLETLVANVRYAAEETAKKGIRLVVEAINSEDMPGFYLNTTRQAVDLLREVDHPNVLIQYDIYHMQIMEGNLIRTIRQNIERIGHMQLADVPGRHEPGTGEINFPNLFKAIDDAGYSGWIGCEYVPSKSTEQSLGWLKEYL
ncbi:MAG TPA: hydroxypyruvate isomerase [Dehalococcoidia bacterium]|nr:hydroxypyruvate isomerase [Dehalococcoidia bacterium]